jgi:CheY-like chemotaxis protein
MGTAGARRGGRDVGVPPAAAVVRPAWKAGSQMVAQNTRMGEGCGCATPRPMSSAAAHMAGAGQPITILLVDDDADCRLLIRDAIGESKVSNTVFEVGSGEEAMEFLTRTGRHTSAPRPGLIYLDIEMPGMGGQEALKRIRTLAEYRDTPVVMMTGVSDEAEMELAAAHGANSYTLKPANAEQFLRTVVASTNYWLEIHQYPRHHLPATECRR